MTSKNRLLDQIRPQEYHLLLTPNMAEFTFRGEETIHCKILGKTKTISLHAKNLVVIGACMKEGGLEYSAKISHNKKGMSVELAFDHVLSPGEKILQITFKGVIGEKLMGWYKSAYTVDGEKRYMATTQFEQIGAREVFPCIDDPSAKAVFVISLRIPKNLTAISNTIEAATEEDGVYKVITFAPTPKMATYALAFIVGEFEYIREKTPSGIIVRIFVTPGKKSQAHFALDTAVKLLPLYEKYFGIQYPLPVLDLIAIPDFDAGAMENWGAITAREVALLVDEKQTSSANKQWVATVIAHELTHMWFGNLVTMKWWDDLWLNEGFASYMEYVGVDSLFPEWNIWEQFAVLDHNRALGLDGLEHTHPIQAHITDVEKVGELFDAVSYSKGASIIQMLVDYIGEKDFRAGIHYYLTKHAYGNAETTDLWQDLEKISGKELEKMMGIYTKKPGYPLVIVSCKGDMLYLSQVRFFNSFLSRKKVKDTTLWSIPLHVASSQNKRESFLFDIRSTTIPFTSYWIKLNAGETSFTRIVYDSLLYERLEQPIQEKRISSIDRMGVLRDVFDSAESGYLPTDRALYLTSMYGNETSYIVWANLTSKLNVVGNLLSETDFLSAFEEYAHSIFIEVGKKVGWEKKQSDVHEDILLRALVLSSLGRYKDIPTIKRAKELFQKIVTQGRNTVDTDIRGVVYALIAESGGEEEFVALQKMYVAEDLATEKNRLGSALCLFEDPVLIGRALNFSLTSDVRSQDIGRFIMGVFGNKRGKRIAWEFVTKHWDMLLVKMEGLGMDWIIEGASEVVSENLLSDITLFFAKHPHPKLEKTMKQVLEQIASNIAWLKRDGEAIEKYLTKRV